MAETLCLRVVKRVVRVGDWVVPKPISSVNPTETHVFKVVDIVKSTRGLILSFRDHSTLSIPLNDLWVVEPSV